MDDTRERLPHLVVPPSGVPSPYRAPNSAGRTERTISRTQHADVLSEQLLKALDAANKWLADRDERLSMEGAGVYLTMLTHDYDVKAFEYRSRGIEVANASRRDDGVYRVVLFVPYRALSYFGKRIAEYRNEDGPFGKPKHHDSVERIKEITFEPAIRALWTDDDARLPVGPERVWWEVWVRKEASIRFGHVVRRMGLEIRDYTLRFPTREVRLVLGSPDEIGQVVLDSLAVSELREAKDRPRSPLEEPIPKQQRIVHNLAERVQPPGPDDVTVTLLDLGVNHKHPLISRATSHEEVTTYNRDWGANDRVGHGTPMAGIALYGDLADHLRTTGPIELRHRLESVKVAPDTVSGAPRQELYGHIYEEAVRIVEEPRGRRRRVFCAALSGPDALGGLLPTQWSAAIDRLTFQNPRRLFVLAVGNLDGTSTIRIDDYPRANLEAHILDPAQAWNALTVGGYTSAAGLSSAALRANKFVAPLGGLAPQSRTAVTWDQRWPVKPDVVFEAGNFTYAPGATHAFAHDELMLLSTAANFTYSPLVPFGFTSGAAALATRMTATLVRELPQFWPETIRGLIVHTANWTPEMLAQIRERPSEERPEKMRRTTSDERLNALRRFGYGVPNVERALASARDDMTMIVESQIRPFTPSGGRANNEMLVFALPWPRRELERIFARKVRLRVTLSYFVDPNPARRGWAGRYSYPSHGLRFSVRRPDEILADFHKRVNKLGGREEGYRNPGPGGGWELGRNARDRGCLISDDWHGMGVDLAQCRHIAVFPVTGWRKELASRSAAGQPVRFSLMVSLRMMEDIATPVDTPVDLYSPVAEQIDTFLRGGNIEI